MAMENSVSNYFLSTFLDSIGILDCRLPGVFMIFILILCENMGSCFLNENLQHQYFIKMFCLIWFFTSQSTIYQLYRDESSWVEPILSKDKCVLLQDTTQWCRWGSNPQSFGLKLSTLPLSHCAPDSLAVINTMPGSHVQVFCYHDSCCCAIWSLHLQSKPIVKPKILQQFRQFEYRQLDMQYTSYSGIYSLVVLFCLIWFFTSHQQSFSYIDVFLGWTSTKLGLMCLAQGHNVVTPVRLKPTALQSWVKHSTTEPLRSWFFSCDQHEPTPGSHVQNKPFNCIICYPSSHWLFHVLIMWFKVNFLVLPIKY